MPVFKLLSNADLTAEKRRIVVLPGGPGICDVCDEACRSDATLCDACSEDVPF